MNAPWHTLFFVSKHEAKNMTTVNDDEDRQRVWSDSLCVLVIASRLLNGDVILWNLAVSLTLFSNYFIQNVVYYLNEY